MDLLEALRKRGYMFRQHVEEEGWGWRKPTVIDLDFIQADALKHGGVEGLRKSMDKQLYRPPWGLFTFPSTDILEPHPKRPDLILASGGMPATTVVSPADNREFWAMASEFVQLLKKDYGFELPLLDESEAKPELLSTQSLIVFGASHQNRLALELALRHRTFFADACVPGDDGWLVMTHCGVHPNNNIVQIVASSSHWTTVKKMIFDSISLREDCLILRHVHRASPGKPMADKIPSWEQFASGLPKRILQLQGRSVEIPTDAKKLSEILAIGLDSGGIEKNLYNVAPIDIAAECAQYYQVTADRRALELFKELLFRLADYYLKTPGGASYPSDIDFRLGLLVLYFSRLEHEDIFDDEERLILANLLLSCMRASHEYARKNWPVEPGAKTTHNHPTFKALTLLYGASYFSRFKLPCVNDWLAYAESVFNCGLMKRSKQRENARSYEPYVFNHAAAYAFFTGRGLEIFSKGCFEKMTGRQIVATDNFLRAVDYGDSRIDMKPAGSDSAKFLATQRDGLFRWFAAESFIRNPDYAPKSIFEYPGILLGPSSAIPESGGWELAEMDPHFLRDNSRGFPRKYAFDKLAFRTGWGNDDHYLLLEGVGGNPSHSHREANGIVRLNHLGRHWLVSNGYGRRVGVANVTKSFSSREQGPADHNMLVLRRNGKTVGKLPMCALLQHGRKGELLYATGALIGYGGVNWFRTLIVLAGKFTVVIERICVLQPGLEKAHIEWNCLGDAVEQKDGFRLEQKGVFMDLASPSAWRAEKTVADQSACWKQVIEDGSYPYASFPLTKLVFHMPEIETGKSACLVTLFAASLSTPQYSISQPAPGKIIIEGVPGTGKVLKISDRDLKIRVTGGLCEIRFNESAEIPATLERWFNNERPSNGI